ncbi:hypothetical protein HSBAA_33360 [Vreelandella sulfidaeris]|uniref:Uncharacterized protein n=1 Tax=Vreelandella sulfidaeris TaxID=115553 RepID=A0A455U797_9GAMM|nr:hypothetical protein HSBAA_33360 [Halomonas sulfidaeris]
MKASGLNTSTLIEKGWACRYKLLENGDNHIMAFLIPGDLCDVHITILKNGSLDTCAYPGDIAQVSSG